MMLHTFETDIWLPRKRTDVFRFFADAFNLEEITPPFLSFRVLTPAPITMEAGTLIDYRLRLRGIPLRWRTRIEVWEPPRRFIDLQLRGPYRRWEHEHLFAEEGSGTRVRDRVRYEVPCGRLIDRLFVRREVTRIFAYRRERLEEIFNGPEGSVAPAQHPEPI